jgi:hypothetical protein
MKLRSPALAALLALAVARPALAEGSGLDVMIDRAADRASVERRVQAVGGLIAGASLLVGGKALLDHTSSEDASDRAAGYVLVGTGAIALASAPFAFFGTSPVERLAEEVRVVPGAPSDPQRLARVDLLVELAADQEARARYVGAWSSGVVGALFLGLSIHEGMNEETDSTARLVRSVGYGAGAAASVVRALLLAKTPGPVGVLADDWFVARAAGAPLGAPPPAPSSLVSSLAVAPLGAGVSLTGAF